MPSACSIRPRSIRERRSRRGSVYVLVLGTALVVTILGLSAVALARIQLQADALATDVDRASILALSATERAVAVVSGDPTWRDTHTHGTETGPEAFGGGTISYRLLDLGADKDLQTTQAIRVEGIGRVGDAVRVHSVEMSGAAPISCLGAALHVDGDILFDGYQLFCDQIISTNGSCDSVSGNEVYAAVEAVGDITGSTYYGATRPFGDGRGVPDPATVFDYYLANGTPIDKGDLTWSSGAWVIDHAVLSPESNPYGAGVVNPEGIYVIDLQGASISIDASRVVGTLVLLNAPVAQTRNQLHMEPAVPGYPVLLVNGPLTLRHDSASPLDEAGAGVNYNPPGAPYRGEVDNDTDDSLECRVEGLIYAAGTITQELVESRVDGVIVGGAGFQFNSSRLELNYDPPYVRKPPPGFRAEPGPLAVVPGSWRWETAP